ncbi:MAG: ABC transporter ATP-binding protein [Planctomycetes bacterium]|nr:ABC transporter ATP-binding protein [Planctomycetota bacterium]MBL7008443.1 ABC transporter ATP-binding protein [Planctomycetota bacterium]
MLRGVDLEVREGEIFGFVGPNGAGKSTFLKCLVGVVRPDSGSIRVDGLDALRQSLEVRRRVGYAPGETALYHRMRCEELIDFAIGFHPRADRALAGELIEVFELPPRRKVGQLSHGMKRKLLLTQALASGAPLLLLDEPMEGLDPDARRLVERLLRREADAGRTVFFSSHDLASVERVCDRVAFLRAGSLLETGDMTELVERLGQVLCLRLREARTADQLPSRPGFSWRGQEREWRLEFEGPLEQAVLAISHLPLDGIRDAEGGLEQVFELLYGPDQAEREEVRP